MMLARRQDVLDSALLLISLQKQWDFPWLIRRKITANASQTEACRKALRAVEAEAAEHGVVDVARARLLLEESERQEGSGVALSAAARYVEARLQLEGLSSVSADTALLLPGTMGISLQAKSTDSALRGKLEMQLELAAIELGLAADAQLSLQSEEYKSALAAVRLAHCGRVEGHIEDAVFKLSVLQGAKQRDDGKNAKQLAGGIRRTRSKIRTLLGARSRLQVLGAGTQAPVVPDKLFADVCAGEFPWRDDPAGDNQGLAAGNGSAPAQKHFARRARAAAARLARTTEETGYLRDQLVRTLGFYLARKSLLEERIAELEGPQQAQPQQDEQQEAQPQQDEQQEAPPPQQQQQQDEQQEAQQQQQQQQQHDEQQPCVGLHGECGAISAPTSMHQAECGSSRCTKRTGQVAILRRALARFTIMEGIARHVLRREIAQLIK